MRKLFILLFLICAFIMGCAETPQPVIDTREFQALPYTAENTESDSDISQPVVEIREFHELPMSSPDNIDFDLTAMSVTMSYAATANMLIDPEYHVGKTVKAAGTYHVWYFDGTGLTYHFIVIEGPPGCCPRALEFVLRDGDYPEEGAKIEIISVFGSYTENDGTFYYLATDSITILE